MNKRMKIGIIRNEKPDTADDWVRACENSGVHYRVIDISSDSWLEQIQSEEFDFYVTHPSGSYERYKTLFDERLHIVAIDLGLKVFPSFNESLIYENKKMLSYFLASHSIPHPETYVFYSFQEAKAFAEKTGYPFVAKTSIGASGSGVKIIRTKADAMAYIEKAFNGSGIKRRFGPNRVTGSPKKWIDKTLRSPGYFWKRMKYYFEINSNAQFGYVIFQKYIEHDFEWRIVKIGESYFAHKKMKVEDKASGGKVKQFGFPPREILDFVDNLCRENEFNCVCVDVFESTVGYLVNEIQCVFGIPYGYLSKVGEDVGRFLKKGSDWEFDKGNFTTNNCCDIKLDTAIKLFNATQSDPGYNLGGNTYGS